jgi:hypothetical protein
MLAPRAKHKFFAMILVENIHILNDLLCENQNKSQFLDDKWKN